MAWISPVGEAHPAYYQPSGEGWLRNFGGGLMTTCGLDQFGPPTRDNGEEFGLHGRIDNTPAEHFSYKGAWHGDEYELVVEASVRQARVFGENLVLNRTIRTALGSTRIDITDQVTNAGFVSQPHMLLYHCNVGFPLLSDQAKLVVDSQAPEPRDEVAEAGLSTWDMVEPPQREFAEQVFLHRLRPGASGISSAMVRNEQAGLAMKLSVQTATLPYLYQWKMMGLGTYVMGLEPANCPEIGGRSAARDLGVLPSLAPQETRTYRLSFEFFHQEHPNEVARGS